MGAFHRAELATAFSLVGTAVLVVPYLGMALVLALYPVWPILAVMAPASAIAGNGLVVFLGLRQRSLWIILQIAISAWSLTVPLLFVFFTPWGLQMLLGAVLGVAGCTIEIRGRRLGAGEAAHDSGLRYLSEDTNSRLSLL